MPKFPTRLIISLVIAKSSTVTTIPFRQRHSDQHLAEQFIHQNLYQYAPKLLHNQRYKHFLQVEPTEWSRINDIGTYRLFYFNDYRTKYDFVLSTLTTVQSIYVHRQAVICHFLSIPCLAVYQRYQYSLYVCYIYHILPSKVQIN
jgi:hypothetical protein